MNNAIETYIEASERIAKDFDVNGEYFIKPILDCQWSLREVEGLMFFKYIKDGKEYDQIVVRQNGENLIKEKEEHTLIVAIDCVKISFLVSNTMKI